MHTEHVKHELSQVERGMDLQLELFKVRDTQANFAFQLTFTPDAVRTPWKRGSHRPQCPRTETSRGEERQGERARGESEANQNQNQDS